MEHESEIEATLKAFAKQEEEIARLLEFESEIVMRMAKVLRAVEADELKPEVETHNTAEISYHEEKKFNPYFSALQSVAREVSGYLHTLAELEEALAEKLKYTMKELRIPEEE